MNLTYTTFISSHLDNTKMNKFMSRFTSTMGGKGTDFQEFFRNLSFLQKHNYSFVIETDLNTVKFLLDESTRKFMCDTFNNLRIIRIVNICEEISFAFGAKPTGFGTQPTNKLSDSYLICSKSAGFFGLPLNVVEFSTYDMHTQSYSQLNQITYDSIKEHNYSFDFSDYHFEKPVKQHTEKRRRIVNEL